MNMILFATSLLLYFNIAHGFGALPPYKIQQHRRQWQSHSWSYRIPTTFYQSTSSNDNEGEKTDENGDLYYVLSSSSKSTDNNDDNIERKNLKERRCIVKKFKQMILLDAREFYFSEKDDIFKPSQKGSSMTVQTYDELKLHLEEVSRNVDQLSNILSEEEMEDEDKNKMYYQDDENTDTYTYYDTSVYGDYNDDDNDDGDSKNDLELCFIYELSKSKRCKVSIFNNQVLIDLREYYQKKGDETWLPTKKGISLTVSQFHKFKSLVDEGVLDRQIERLEN